MEVLKKIGRWLLWTLLGIIGLLIVYLLFAILLGLIPVNSDFKESPEGVDIYISSNGVHTNIIIPSKYGQYNWGNALSFNKEYKYLAFGWGDKEFYMNTPEWSDLKIFTTLKAAFLPTSSVIQVYGIRETPGISKRTKKIRLSNEQYKIIGLYLYNSFQFDENNEPIELKPVGGSGFYRYFEANGKYTLFFTCNNWTSRGLKKAGIKNSVWAPFDKSVLYYLK